MLRMLRCPQNGGYRQYEQTRPANSKLSISASVGLIGGDEWQYTRIEIFVFRGGSQDHYVGKRVKDFAQTNGIPSHALSLMGMGERFLIQVTNDDPYSQTYRTIWVYQDIP